MLQQLTIFLPLIAKLEKITGYEEVVSAKDKTLHVLNSYIKKVSTVA
jgi:hypothetical protein